MSTIRQIVSTEVPLALSEDRRLKAMDIVVYLHLACYYRTGKNRGQSLYAHAKSSGISYESFRRSARNLLRWDWAYEAPGGRWSFVVPWMPMKVEEVIVQRLERIREEVPYMGEWLMKCILDLMIPNEDYGDNARPSWLVSGEGSGRYELDRWYRSAGVAFEFQGPQHFRAGGSLNTNESDVEQQMLRDRIKAGICNMEGIRLIQVTASDLSYYRIADKVRGLFPLQPIRENRPLFRAVDQMCRRYMNYVSRDDKWSHSQ